MAEYSYKGNRPTPSLPAQDVGEELERIRAEHGELTAPVVVEASRPRDAVLHREVDLHLSVRERAELWSRHKARNLINVVTVVPERPDGAAGGHPVPAFVNVTVGPAHAPESRTYEPVADILADPVKRAALLQRFLEKFVRLRREFGHLRELDAVWAAGEAVVLAGGESAAE